MKKAYLFILFLAIGKLLYAQNFTEGNLVIYRLGNDEGTSPINTQTSAVPIFLEEYDISGSTAELEQSVPLPTTTSGSNKRIVAVGNASIEGLMTRSADGRFLVIPGYDQSLGGNASNRPAADVNRVVALVDYQKNINTTTSLDNPNTDNSFRSATSYEGTNIWTGGGGTGAATGGIWSATTGATSATRIGGASFYQVKIYNGNLYGTLGNNIYEVITGVPGGTPSLLSARKRFTDNDVTGANSFTIVQVGTTDIAYVLQYGSGTFKIRKFTIESNGLWSPKGTLDGPSTSYGTAIEARVVGSNVELYVVSSAANTSTSVARLYKIVDTSALTADITGTATEIKSWPATQNIRGIAWAPVQHSTLPVKLTDFKAKQAGSSVQLTWTTASEKDNAQFEVLKSTGEGFRVIGTVAGKGTTATANTYSFTDYELSNGTVYYQLRQVDTDGKSDLSDVIPFTANLAIQEKVTVNASISNQQVKVIVFAEQSSKGKVTIRDASGKLIAEQEINLTAGENAASFPVLLKEAVYVAFVSESGKNHAVKFIPGN